MPITETTDTSATIRQSVDLPRERVYEAFTTPEQLEDWQSGEGFAVEVHEFDATPGGDISITHVNEEGRFDIEGTVEDVTENERIAHTWRFVNPPAELPGGDDATHITVEFVAVDGGTEVVFTHVGLAPEMVEETAGGWDWILGQLEELE